MNKLESVVYFSQVIILCYLLLLFRFYYNDACYLTEDKRKDLREAVFAICEVYEQQNQTHWIDFGTLLGAYRSGDVLPHDGDADVSRLEHNMIKLESIQWMPFRCDTSVQRMRR